MMRTLLNSLFLLIFPLVLKAQVSDSVLYDLQEVEVSTTLRPSTSQSAVPLQVLTESEILKQGIQSVADAVKRFNGVVLKDFGGIGGLKTISVRGMGAEYTTISYDGMVVSNSQSGQVDIGRFTLDNISMLSLSIGQDDNIFQTAKAFASAGVLSLQTKKPEFTDKNYTLDGRVTTGSFGHFEPMINYARKLSRKTSISANINWQRADGKYPFTQEDDHDMTDRKRNNSDINILRTEVNLYNKLSKKDDLDVKLYYFDSERGLPGSVVLYNYEKKDRLWDKNAFAQLTYNRRFDSQWKFKSVGKYDYNYQKYKTDLFKDGQPIDGFNRYRQHEVYWSNILSYKINSHFSTSLAQDLTFNNLRNEFSSYNELRSEPNRYSSFTALALQYKSERISLTASGLNTYVYEKITNKNRKNIYRKLSPAFSASVKPIKSADWRLRASYKHIYRIPTFNEMYFVNTERGLKPESSSQYNIGTTWVSSLNSGILQYINFSLDGYYNDVKNKIVIVPVPFLPSVTNTGKVKMKGVDAKLASNIKVTDQINLDLVGIYSFMRAYDDDKESENTYKGQLPYTPKHSGSASLTVNSPWLALTYSLIASGERYTNAENIPANWLDSYTDHSISAFKEIDMGSYKLYGTASLLNMLGKNYAVIKYYPMPGRSFKVSIGCRF